MKTSILRNIVSSAYKHTLYTEIGVPVTFDLSSKDVGDFRVNYELSPSFLLKAKMGLYDDQFDPSYTVMDWIAEREECNQQSYDIGQLLRDHVDFYDGQGRSHPFIQYPIGQKPGFVDFLHRCLTEFKRSLDKDVLDSFQLERDSEEGVPLYKTLQGILRGRAVHMALFRRMELEGNGDESGCFADYGRLASLFGLWCSFTRYRPEVVEYFREKLS